MRVEIYSIKNILFEGDATSVNCKTAKGEITVLENHEPLISLLQEGSIVVTTPDGEKHHFAAKGGFLEVQSTNTARFIVEE